MGGAFQIGDVGGNPQGGLATGRSALVGGLLVLKPSQDITLQTGQAPSLVGNFTFQFNITVKNTSQTDVVSPQLFVITANSGFFESIRGSSRIIKGVLSEQDIISAPLAPMGGTRSELKRYVGGGLLGSLATAMKRLPAFLGKHASTIGSLGKAAMEHFGSKDAGVHMGAGGGAGRPSVGSGKRGGMSARLM